MSPVGTGGALAGVRLAAGALLLATLACTTPVSGTGGSAVQERERGLDEDTVTFVLGNLEFVLLHELAHVVLGELKVPVLGPEEDTADYLAATALLVVGREDPARAARVASLLMAAADGLALSWRVGQDAGARIPYWNQHALNIQRFYTVVCLLYGSDPEGFRELPDRVGMPAARAAGCGAEFEKSNRAFRWLLGTWGRGSGEPAGSEVTIVYEPAPTLVSAELLRHVREDELLERVARRLQEKILLPRPITFVMRRCGRSEAAWQPGQQALVLCYELLDTFYRLDGYRSAPTG